MASKQAKAPAKPFTLADLQRACRTAGAPIVQDTPSAREVVTWVQEFRNAIATAPPPELRARIQRWKRVHAAWAVIRSELALLKDPVRARAADRTHGTQFRVMQLPRLMELESAMDRAERHILDGPRPRHRGQHGAPSTPPPPIIMSLVRCLSSAFGEAGRGKATLADMYRVVGDILGSSPDAVRKALVRATQRPKHGTK